MPDTASLAPPPTNPVHQDRHSLSAANAARARSGAMTRLSVLVPLSNQRWTIGPMLERLLSAPISMDLEVVVVDDGSTDGGPEVVQRFADRDSRVKLLASPLREGRGATVRRAIREMTGDVAVIQDADAGFDPHELPRLLRPVLAGHADAVYGSRLAGAERRTMPFWTTFGTRLMKLGINALTNLNLADSPTGYKVIRADILRQLRLAAKGQDIDAELHCRLAQWGARIYEAPVSYHGGDLDDERRSGPVAGLRSLGRTVWSKLWDNCFTEHTGMYVLRSCDKAKRYNRWLLRQVDRYLGDRLLEAGSGIGNLSQLLTKRERLVLADHDPLYVEMLTNRFAGRTNVDVRQIDLTEERFDDGLADQPLDTILCSNVLEHLEPHEQVLAGFHRALEPGGHCVIIVPAEPRLYTPLDRALGHYRRYTQESLEAAMRGAGFEIVTTRQSCKTGAAAWLFNGRLMRRESLTPRQMLWFDRLWPLIERVDHLLPWPGMTLITVGRKPAS